MSCAQRMAADSDADVEALLIEYQALKAPGYQIAAETNRRDQVVSELRDLVGAKRAAKLLGISRGRLRNHLTRLEERA